MTQEQNYDGLLHSNEEEIAKQYAAAIEAVENAKARALRGARALRELNGYTKIGMSGLNLRYDKKTDEWYAHVTVKATVLF